MYLDLAVGELVQLRAVGLRDVHRLVRVRVRVRVSGLADVHHLRLMAKIGLVHLG